MLAAGLIAVRSQQVVGVDTSDPDALDVARFAVGNSAAFYHGATEDVMFTLMEASKEENDRGTVFALRLQTMASPYQRAQLRVTACW